MAGWGEVLGRELVERGSAWGVVKSENREPGVIGSARCARAEDVVEGIERTGE